jgi:hypothetical protein
MTLLYDPAAPRAADYAAQRSKYLKEHLIVRAGNALSVDAGEHDPLLDLVVVRHAAAREDNTAICRKGDENQRRKFERTACGP